MGDGAAFDFDDANDAGNLIGVNLNSLDAGGNVSKTPGQALQVEVSVLRYRNRTGSNPVAFELIASSNNAVLASNTNFVFVALDTNSLTINQSGFPDPAVIEHIPLAEVVTNGTAIVSFTDKRPQLLSSDWLRPARYTVATLPTPLAGTVFAFATDGRSTGRAEGPAAGTGVPVYWTGALWASFEDGAPVAA